MQTDHTSLLTEAGEGLEAHTTCLLDVADRTWKTQTNTSKDIHFDKEYEDMLQGAFALG